MASSFAIDLAIALRLELMLKRRFWLFLAKKIYRHTVQAKSILFKQRAYIYYIIHSHYMRQVE